MRKLVAALFALSLLAMSSMEAAAAKGKSAEAAVKSGDPVVPAGRVVFDVRTGGNSNPCGRGEERPAADCDPPPSSNQVCCKWVNASSARAAAPGRMSTAGPRKGGGASPAGRIVYDTEKIDKGCPKGSQSVSDDHCEPRPKMNELCCKTQTQ